MQHIENYRTINRAMIAISNDAAIGDEQKAALFIRIARSARAFAATLMERHNYERYIENPEAINERLGTIIVDLAGDSPDEPIERGAASPAPGERP